MKILAVLCGLLLGISVSWAQSVNLAKQTIRGRIVDAQSKFPLIGVNVVVLNADPVIGTVTDVQGYYTLQEVPLGRQTLRVSYMGYKEQVVPNVMVTSGKEVVLNLELVEQVIKGAEVVITAKPNKTITNNEFASVSSRSFNLEETGRYAASRNDPARMAANFAGVAANNDDRNDIIIRGNSPSGLLWRLEGINIPNPSHYGSLSASGGPISLLNYNLLDKSDFMTAAFPAEYGNALAGVFDLQLRSGNSQKHEFLGQIGINGLEVGAEGPISKKSRASYLASYRYSTLGVYKEVGLNFGTGSATPEYQDLTFKIDIPISESGRFTFFGIGGKSNVDLINSNEDVDVIYGNSFTNDYADYKTGILGLSHQYYFNSTFYYKLSLSASRQEEHLYRDSLSLVDQTPIPAGKADYINNKYSAHLLLNKKFSARDNVSGGAILDLYDFDLSNRRLVPGQERINRDVDGQSLLSQTYIQWQHRFSNTLTLNTGVNYQQFEVSNSKVIQPRAGLQYDLSDRQTLGLGYGQHNQIQPLDIYFVQTVLPGGTVAETNRNLDFTNSQHFVLSYEYRIATNLRLKAETYYQKIDAAAVEKHPSSFSLLNAGVDFEPINVDSLVNSGEGENYGIEFTLEKFYSKGYYFLFTTSLYKSHYKGSNNEWHSTAFNGGYIANLLGGKEFKIGKKNNTFSVDGKFTTSGGNRYTPIDYARSAQLGYEVHQDDLAYSKSLKQYVRADLKLSYRINHRGSTHEFALDLQNITNRQNEFARIYNPRSNTVQTQYQIGFFPVPQYRITF
ncbi:carboxypeptidase-like regulatory domain-containing protein [Pontibacter silvestris]|uniref:Carboxypeptidase-like regulatory domain-containing protein n=1 Tax=Pontibacter silvestris TaxID=2305183 RepID=A0ABW4X4K8_9BACT|nr:TonB-dependent receptor [Pontibacter silvestris]MCC9138352.1 TonB-dependent receptor [Pontibacter silvestris]